MLRDTAERPVAVPPLAGDADGRDPEGPHRCARQLQNRAYLVGILGRGSFIESFPLFGYALEQYEVLFEEKLDPFATLLEAEVRFLAMGAHALAVHGVRGLAAPYLARDALLPLGH